MKLKNVTIYKYLDCRKYLKDKCDYLKTIQSGFSYRNLSIKAGIKSPGFLSGFISGKKKVSQNTALKIAHALELTSDETTFFLNLLTFTQSDNHEEKMYALDRCLKQVDKKSYVSAHALMVYEYYSNWYNVVIRDLIAVFEIKDNYEYLASLLDPPIRPDEAEKSINLLTRLGLIKKNKDGCFDRSHRFLTSKSMIRTTAVWDFQIAMMRNAIRSLQSKGKEERDISTLTISIDHKTFEHIKNMIDTFRSSVLSLVNTVENPSRVVQLNVQLFPVSKMIEKSI